MFSCWIIFSLEFRPWVLSYRPPSPANKTRGHDGLVDSSELKRLKDYTQVERVFKRPDSSMQANELVGEKKGNDNGAYEREAQTTCTMIRKYIALLLLLLLYRMSSSLLNSHCQHPVGPQQMLMIRNNPFWRLVYLEPSTGPCATLLLFFFPGKKSRLKRRFTCIR